MLFYLVLRYGIRELSLDLRETLLYKSFKVIRLTNDVNNMP